MTAVQRTALVTGASAGIGEAFADVFAAGGFDLIVTARREDRLRTLAARIERAHGRRVHVMPADLADPSGPARLCERVANEGLAVDALVNSAGYGLPGSYIRTTWEDQSRFLQLMLVSIAELTHRLLPAMVERRYGRIIQVSSLAGLFPAPAGHTLYAPTKSFLIRFAEALSLEVGRHGVHVTAVCPGFTYTEFHDVNQTRAIVSRSMPRFMWMDAPTVARQGYDAVMAGRPVVVNGRLNSALAVLGRALPHRVVHRAMGRLSSGYRRT